jgi:hypothetical protein
MIAITKYITNAATTQVSILRMTSYVSSVVPAASTFLILATANKYFQAIATELNISARGNGDKA